MTPFRRSGILPLAFLLRLGGRKGRCHGAPPAGHHRPRPGGRQRLGRGPVERDSARGPGRGDGPSGRRGPRGRPVPRAPHDGPPRGRPDDPLRLPEGPRERRDRLQEERGRREDVVGPPADARELGDVPRDAHDPQDRGPRRQEAPPPLLRPLPDPAVGERGRRRDVVRASADRALRRDRGHGVASGAARREPPRDVPRRRPLLPGGREGRRDLPALPGAVGGRGAHLGRAAARPPVGRGAPLRARPGAIARRETSRRAPPREPPREELPRHFLGRRGGDLVGAARVALEPHRRPPRPALRARWPAVRHLPRHGRGQPDPRRLGRLGGPLGGPRRGPRRDSTGCGS